MARLNPRLNLVKGVRDIASGLFVIILIVAGATHLLGWVILAATIIPLADAAIVLDNGGPKSKSIAWGVHGVTAGADVASGRMSSTVPRLKETRWPVCSRCATAAARVSSGSAMMSEPALRSKQSSQFQNTRRTGP